MRLAAAIASRIVRREIAQQGDVAVTLVREALELASGAARVTIHLNPDDFQSLADHVQSVVLQLAKTAQTEIIADGEVSPGGCRLTTEFGEIDQRVESQLARIVEEFTGA